MQAKQRFDLTFLSFSAKKTWLAALFWLLALAAGAQDSLEKARLDIWTETAAFVYRDAKMAEPAAVVNAASMTDFVAAIKKEDAKSSIYSKLYQPIEQTGTYRKGADAKAQLDLLIRSIYSKLRENSQRMADLSRRKRLDDMIKQLQQIASDYTAPAAATAPAGQDEESVVPADRTATDPDTALEAAYAENQLSSRAKREGASRKPDWVSILALVLGLLNLGLIFYLFKGVNKLNLRLDQRKKELETLSQQVNGVGVKGGEGNSKMTLSAIESLVQKTIAKELGHRPQPEARPTAAAPLAAAVATTVPVSEAPSPAPVQQHPAPMPVAPAPAAEAETPAPANPAEEVETPAPAAPVAEGETPAPAPAPSPEKPVSFFARVPVNGGFHEQDLYPTPQHDSIYEIRVSRKDPNKAAFRIVTNTAVHRSAIESAYLSLKDACNYQMNHQHATRIVTDEPGTLSFQNGFWLIDRKAQVHFE